VGGPLTVQVLRKGRNKKRYKGELLGTLRPVRRLDEGFVTSGGGVGGSPKADQIRAADLSRSRLAEGVAT